MKMVLRDGERCEASIYHRYSGIGQCSKRSTTEREERKNRWSDEPIVRMRRVCGTHAAAKYGVTFVQTAEERRWREANETWRTWKRQEQRAEDQLRQARQRLWDTGLAECPECEYHDTFWRADLESHRASAHGVKPSAEVWSEIMASLDAPLEVQQ
jgi:hypothetical protein